jgi:hypothetical protein
LFVLFGLGLALMTFVAGGLDVGPMAILIAAHLALGAALIAGVRLARWIPAALFAVLAVLGPIETIRDLGVVADADIVPVANALAMAALSTWLCAVAALRLLRTSERPSRLTPRIAGAAIAVVAATHVYAAIRTGAPWLPGAPRPGDDLAVGMSLSISTSGAWIGGFPGWPLWHALAGVAGLGLVVGGRAARASASALIGLLLYVAVAGLFFDPLGDTAFRALDAVLVAIPLYLLVWLRVELGRSDRYTM